MKKFFDTSELEFEVFSDTDNLRDMTDEEFREADGIEENDFPALELELTLSDGSILVYEAVGVFVLGEKEYMALHPKNDTEGIIHIMELTQGEDDEIKLLPVEDDKEFEMATEAFYRLIADRNVEGEGYND